MKNFKAMVKCKETGRHVTIESECRTKAEFVRDLRGNGYMVNPMKVKVAEVFDYIVNETNCAPWDWKENN